MARIRTIKPDFWSDDVVGALTRDARLLFIATWNFADDHGGLERSAKQLKAQVFPYDEIDCEPIVQELLDAGLLIEYQANGKKYLHIKGFRKHQKNERPASPRVPLYNGATAKHSGGTDASLGVTDTTRGVTARTRGSSLGREGKIKEEPLKTEALTRARTELSRGGPDITDAGLAMDRIQEIYPTGSNASNWTLALHHANCLVSDGFATWEVLVDAVERYRSYFDQGKGAMNVGAHNFFDPRKGNWNQSWTVTTAADTRLATNIESANAAEEAIFGGLPE